MAITIEQQNSGIVNAYNPIDYVASSTNTGQTSFKYIADLYIDGVNVHRYLIPADPNFSECFVNTSDIVQSYLSFNFDATLSDTVVEENGNSIVETYIEFGEQYDVAGTITDFTALATTNTIKALNGALDFESYIDYDYTDYEIDGTGANKFLTNAPLTRTVSDTMNHWLYAITDESTIYPHLFVIRTYDINGTLNGQFQINNNNRGGGALEDDHIRIASGLNINNLTVDAVVTGATPILDADVYSYSIQMYDTGITSTSELRTFNIDYDCLGLDKYVLHFQNALGGFDSFSFDLVNRFEWDKETQNYMSAGYTRSSGAVSRATSTHQRKSYNTTVKKSISLKSNWITEAESLWLRELFDSPVIYLEYPDNTMIAVSGISLTQKTEDITKVDKLFNLELVAEYSFDSYRQKW